MNMKMFPRDKGTLEMKMFALAKIQVDTRKQP
jgi:hypothetical protein